MRSSPTRSTSMFARRAMLLGAAVFVMAASAPWHTTDAPIADALMRGEGARVRELIKQGADVNAAQSDGMTALHWAATQGDADAAKMLIFAGARLEAVTRNGNYTALHLAARSGNATVLKALLDAGASTKAATSSGGATPLHFAASNGNAETVKALIDHKAAVDARDVAFAQTPLMWAAAAGRVQAIQALLAGGADTKLTSKIENMAVIEKAQRAAVQLRAKRVAALRAVDNPPPPPVLRGRGGAPAAGAVTAVAGKDSLGLPKLPKDSVATKPALKDSAMKKSPPAAALAKKAAGDSAAAKPKVSDSAMAAAKTYADSAFAAGGGRGGMTYGELVGNKGGLTALLFAIREGHADAAMALIKGGSDINQPSAGDHTTPLLMAIINGHFDLARQMVTMGANPKLASDAGATPLYATINLQWAAKSLYPQPTAQLQQKSTYLELMEDLIKAGADVNARLTKHLWYVGFNFDLLGVNTAGATPFWRAAYGTDVAAMKMLIAHGANPNIPTLKPAGRQINADGQPEDSSAVDPSGLPPVPAGGPGVYPIHAASGAGYGDGFAANSHMHAPDGWLPSVKYLVEDLHLDVNQRDFNGYNAIHDAAARGDNQLIEYLVSKGADVKAVSRKGQTTADMANGPVQRVPPFDSTVTLLEKLGSKNSHKCKSC
jgi:ankyrin repeat protein